VSTKLIPEIERRRADLDSGAADIASSEEPENEGMRWILLISLFAALALLITAPAFGGTIAVTLGLGSGALTAQSTTASAQAGQSVQIPVTVADARGTGAGWTLKLASATPVTVTAITARCATNSTCTLPKISSTANSQALQIAPGTGMGVMQLTVTLAPLAAGQAAVPVAFTASR
jgi:hypothetical protein